VDDEPLVLRAFARGLRTHYEVTALSSAQEALERLASGERWDLVLSDVMMPGIDGVEFARRVVANHPELAGRIVLMSGGTTPRGGQDAPDPRAWPLISKPIELQTLIATLARIDAGRSP
jgi:CheY-like chemotaxis protein